MPVALPTSRMFYAGEALGAMYKTGIKIWEPKAAEPALDPVRYLDGHIGWVTAPTTGNETSVPANESRTMVMRYQADGPWTDSPHGFGAQSPGWAGDYLNNLLHFAPEKTTIRTQVTYGGGTHVHFPYVAPTGPSKQWLALTIRNMSNGTGAVYISKTSTDGKTWTVIDETQAGGGYVNGGGAVQIRVGVGGDHLQSYPFPGKVHLMEYRKGEDPVGGEVVWRMNPDESAGESSWTDPRGRTWTLSAPGAIPWWKPTEIDGCVAWWDPSTLTLLDGEEVLRLPDLSGVGQDLVIDPIGAPPRFAAAALNGRGVLRFDGTNVLVTPLAVDYRQFFVVAKYNSATFADYDGLLSGELIHLLIGEGLQVYWYGLPVNSRYHMNGIDYPGLTSLPAPMQQWAMMSLGNDSGWGAMGPFRLGLDRIYTPAIGYNRHWKGDIAEVIAYGRRLPDSERLQVENYLRQKWSTP